VGTGGREPFVLEKVQEVVVSGTLWAQHPFELDFEEGVTRSGVLCYNMQELMRHVLICAVHGDTISGSASAIVTFCMDVGAALWVEQLGCMWVLHASEVVGLKKTTYEQKITAFKWGPNCSGGRDWMTRD
jgi:hypothetical protein